MTISDRDAATPAGLSPFPTPLEFSGGCLGAKGVPGCVVRAGPTAGPAANLSWCKKENEPAHSPRSNPSC
jgi:hypothetical protein